MKPKQPIRNDQKIQAAVDEWLQEQGYISGLVKVLQGYTLDYKLIIIGSVPEDKLLAHLQEEFPFKECESVKRESWPVA